MIVQLHIHFGRCTEPATDTGIHQSRSVTIGKSGSIEVVHCSVELMVCTIKRVESLELISRTFIPT